MGSNFCTFEASRFWRELLVTEFPLREYRVDYDGCSIFLWKHRLHDRFISTPFRDRLALGWDGSLSPNLSLSVLEMRIRDSLSKGDSESRIILKDILPYLKQENGTALALSQSHTNCDVSLDDGIMTRIDRSARKNLRKAREDYGLQFCVNSLGTFEDFFSLYLQTRKRLGVAPYRRSFFQKIFDVMGEYSFVFSCRQGNSDVGYLICYVHNEELISAHIAYDYMKRHMKIADFLYLNTFEWGLKNRYTNYRFGGDYNSQKSLISSKVKLGAVPRTQMDFVLPKGSYTFRDTNTLVQSFLKRIPTAVYSPVALATLVYFE